MSPRRPQLALEDSLLLLPVVLLPWAFGGVEMWAMRGAALLLAAGAAVVLVRDGWAGLGLGRGRSWWLVPALLLLAWGIVQIVPMSPPAIERLSPEAARVYRATVEPTGGQSPATPMLERMRARALEQIPEAAAKPPRVDNVPEWELAPLEDCQRDGWTLSLWPAGTVESLFWFGALLAGFLAIRRRASLRRVHVVYRTALFGGFAALAVFALLQSASGAERLYWVRPVMSAASDPFGPYVNPGHLAGLLELAVPWMAAWAWSRFRLFGRDALGDPRFLAGAGGAAVCLVAGVVSASKAAAVLMGISLLALCLLGLRGWRHRLLALGAALLLAAGAALLLADTRLGERMGVLLARSQGGHLAGSRQASWGAARAMLADYPLTGVGFGAFGEAYPQYMPRGTHLRMSQAHNDYLEVLVEGGLIAGVLVAWLMIGFAWRAARVRAAAFPGGSLARLGLLIGIAALALHALVDFNHQIPANGLTFVALCAMAVPLEDEPDEDER